MKIEKRRSNIELLRIFSILFIIIFHCAYKSGFDFGNGMSANKLIVKTCWMFGELGVNEFVLVSGFFLVSGSFRIKKLIRLVAEVEFYYWGTTLFAYLMGIRHFSGWKEMILGLFPVLSGRYWFFTAYILIYILSPYLNRFAGTMDREMYRRFLATVLILYSVVPTIFGILYNDTETLLYYTRFLWLMIMYLLGAYIRCDDDCRTFLENRAGLVSVVSFTVCVISIPVFDLLNSVLEGTGAPVLETAYFWHPNSLPMLFLSIGVFSLFLKMEIPYSRPVNRLASTTLGIYLLHDIVLQDWIWGSVFHCASYQESPYLILYYCKSSDDDFYHRCIC